MKRIIAVVDGVEVSEIKGGHNIQITGRGGLKSVMGREDYRKLIEVLYERRLHRCHPGEQGAAFPWTGVSAAVTHCEENEDGQLWVEGGQRSNQVNFCPFCGYEATSKWEAA